MARQFREPGEERRWKAAGKLDGVGSGTGLSKGDEESEAEEAHRRGYAASSSGAGVGSGRTLRSVTYGRDAH
jgi:hypothetical protein